VLVLVGLWNTLYSNLDCILCIVISRKLISLLFYFSSKLNIIMYTVESFYYLFYVCNGMVV
jgi:hypothetical protein